MTGRRNTSSTHLRATARALRHARLGAVALSLVIGATACSGGESSPTRPAAEPAGAKLGTSLVALIDQALAKPDLSTEVRVILRRAKAAGSISAADYESAFSAYAKCVKDAGVTEEYAKLSTGIYQVIPHYATTSETAHRADFDKSNACGLKHIADVEALYSLQVGNPDLLSDTNEVATRCLVTAGVVKADFTSEAFAELVEKNFEGAPFDTASPAFTQCLASAGMAVSRKP